MPVIYADIVWVVNLVMDAMILWATSWIVRRKVRLWRLGLGALFASAYSLLLFVPHASLFTTWIFKAVASLIMVVIAIPFRGLLDLARNTVILYCVTFLLAGAVLAMHFAVPAMSLENGTIIHGGRLAFTTSVGSLAIVVAIPVGLWTIHVAIGKAKRLRRESSSLCQTYARLGERKTTFVGLLDTGNQLLDPLTRRPVCLVDAQVFRELVPPELGRLVEAGVDVVSRLGELTLEADLPALSLVPYRGAGGVQKITVAIRPDEVRVVLADGTSHLALPCLFALHTLPLSGDGRFQAVLHTELIAGDDKHDKEQKSFLPQHEAADSVATLMDSGSH